MIMLTKSQNFFAWLSILTCSSTLLLTRADDLFVDFDENEDIIPPPVEHAPQSFKNQFVKHVHPDYIPTWIFIGVIISCIVAIFAFIAYCIYSLLRKHKKAKRKIKYEEEDEPISLDQI